MDDAPLDIGEPGTSQEPRVLLLNTASARAW
jgi:hypothetical protein